MKGKQLAMDSALADLDRYEIERERRETDAIKARLDARYERINYRKLAAAEYPAGSVVIIGQNLCRARWSWHFYRTVLNYYSACHDPHRAIFVEARSEEYPERPPWADTVGHEGEPRDICWLGDLIYWITGEVVEPVKTWWMKEWYGEE